MNEVPITASTTRGGLGAFLTWATSGLPLAPDPPLITGSWLTRGVGAADLGDRCLYRHGALSPTGFPTAFAILTHYR